MLGRIAPAPYQKNRQAKGKRNREIPMDVLDDRVKAILLNLCQNKKADEYVFVNPNTKKPYTDVKRHSVQHAN